MALVPTISKRQPMTSPEDQSPVSTGFDIIASVPALFIINKLLEVKETEKLLLSSPALSNVLFLKEDRILTLFKHAVVGEPPGCDSTSSSPIIAASTSKYQIPSLTP